MAWTSGQPAFLYGGNHRTGKGPYHGGTHYGFLQSGGDCRTDHGFEPGYISGHPAYGECLISPSDDLYAGPEPKTDCRG